MMKKLWLRIWNRIKRLFGKREMEIEETINKCFDKTFAMYQEKVHPYQKVNPLMMGVLRYSRHCSITIFSLLRQEVKLSSMVLLRVYFELYIKVCWCLINDPNSQKGHKDEVYGRFRRWDFKRLIEQRKLLGKLQEVRKDDSNLKICKAIKEADDSIGKYKTQGLKCIPDIWQILKELSEAETQESPEDILGLYPRLYQRFNKAVHPDMDFIRKMAINTGEASVCSCDVNEDIQTLKFCLLFISCGINRKIRDFYGWDSAEVQKEFNLIVKQLDN